MSKPDESVQDLKRRLILLDRLGGRPLITSDGVALIAPAEPLTIREPRALADACAEGWPSAAALAACVDLTTPPMIVRPALLATMQRDLRALSKWPGLADFAAEAPRIFRRFGALDRAWIADKQARLAALAEATRSAEAAADEAAASGERAGDDARDRGAAADPWFARVRALIAALRGDSAAAAIDDALAHLRDDSRRRRRGARRRLAELAQALAGGRPASPAIAEAAAALRSAERWPGRGRQRRIEQIVGRVLDLPTPARTPMSAGRRALAVEIAAVGERLIATIQPTRGPAIVADARRVLGLYGLAFAPAGRDGEPLQLSPARVQKGLAAFDRAQGRFAGLGLTIDEVLRLLALEPSRGEATVAALVAGGLPIAAVEGLAARERLDDLRRFEGEPAAAAAYAGWYLTLAPHYEALGVEIPLAPAIFKRIAGRKGDLGVLALCLMSHHGTAGAVGADAALARLDGTLGLFQRRPAEADRILDALSATAPGAGRAAFPAFAAWLGDDPLIDRYVHLARLAGREVALSRRLRADFERGAALEREREHLNNMSSRTDKQELRLRRLAADEVAPPDPSWTRRRLAEETDGLLAAAYDAQIDRVFGALVKEVWGFSLERLSPAWRDAIRFYLGTERNHELLRVVLRAAAAGASLETLPKNQAWITAARGRFAVDAWLGPRRRTLTIGGQPCVIEVERDPVEVLRMGVPFDTCLSIDGGFNAASTVINAADANKAVIYLRDRRRKIIARKLLALSTDDALIGYQLYIADRDHVDEIRGAFARMSAEIAAEAGVPMAYQGAPEQLHAGFWYDDGVVPFEGPTPTSAEVAALCDALGVPAPERPGERLIAEAALFAALAGGDEGAVIAAVGEASSPSALHERAIAWLRARLPSEELQRTCPNDTLILRDLTFAALAGDPLPLLTRASDLNSWRYCERLTVLLPAPGLAAALVDAVLARRRRGVRFDDHELEHRSLDLLPRWIAAASVAQALTLAGRIAPAWAWIAEVAPDCAQCVDHGEEQLLDAIAALYRASPDPAALRDALTARRLPRLARRAALAIAGRSAAWSPGDEAASALRALHRLARREPWVADEPDLVAALLRGSGGALPHGVALPRSAGAPFEALGPLVDAPAIAAHLGPWLGPPPADLGAWSPSPREFQAHRRAPAGLRDHLRATARRQAPFASPAALWLARLGDVAGLEELAACTPGPDVQRRSRLPLQMHQAIDAARTIATQADALARGALAGLPIEALRSAGNALGRLTIDPAITDLALATIERALAGDPPAPDELAAAARLIDPSLLAVRAREALLARLVAGAPGSLPPPLVRLATDLLGPRTFLWHGLTPALALAIARHPELRPALVSHVVFAFQDNLEIGLQSLRAAATTADEAALAEALIRDLLAGFVDEHPSEVTWLDEATFAAGVALMIGKHSARRALCALYSEIWSPTRAATLLGALIRAGLLGDPDLAATLDDIDDDDDDDDRDADARRTWLRAAVAGALSRPPGLAAPFPGPAEAATLTRP